MPIDDVWLTGEPMVGVNGRRVPHTDIAANGARSSGPSEFDPRSFDPGPDLPPLPTLRPLPAIKPLGSWPSGPLPDQAARPDEAARPNQAARPDENMVSDEAGSPDEAPVPDVLTATADAPPIRHRRRAADLDDDAAENGTAAPARPAGPNRGRRILVLGGSGTIGSAVARILAEQGARVAVHHATRGAEAGRSVAGLPGSGHLTVGADLADAEAVAALIASVDDQFDGLDVVINAASAADSVGRPALVGSSLAEWTEAWTGTLTVDVLGAATVVHAAAAAFIARGRAGRIILVAAKGRAADGTPSTVARATEKAVAALGSALAAELAPHQVGLTVVGSGAAASSGWSPETLAETVAWLASGPSAALPGAVFDIAG